MVDAQDAQDLVVVGRSARQNKSIYRPMALKARNLYEIGKIVSSRFPKQVTAVAKSVRAAAEHHGVNESLVRFFCGNLNDEPSSHVRNWRTAGESMELEYALKAGYVRAIDKQPKRSPKGRKSLFTKEQESEIVAWIAWHAANNMPVTQAYIIENVNEAYAEHLASRGHCEPLSTGWYRGFAKRNSLTSVPAKPQDELRLKWSTSSNLLRHTKVVSDLLVKLKFGEWVNNPNWEDDGSYCAEKVVQVTRPERIISFDETSLSDTTMNTSRAVVSSSAEKAVCRGKKEKNRCSLICATRMDGKVFPPAFILMKSCFLQGKDLPSGTVVPESESPLKKRDEASLPLWGASENGSVVGHKMTISFLQHLRDHYDECTEDNPLIVITDGHSSHVAPQVVKWCVDHNVHLVIRPPHTTALIQPEDVGVFGPFKSAYNAKLMELYVNSGINSSKSGDKCELQLTAINYAYGKIKKSRVMMAWEDAGYGEFITGSPGWALKKVEDAKREMKEKVVKGRKSRSGATSPNSTLQFPEWQGQSSTAATSSPSRSPPKKKPMRYGSTMFWNAESGLMTTPGSQKIAQTREREVAEREKKKEEAAKKKSIDKTNLISEWKSKLPDLLSRHKKNERDLKKTDYLFLLKGFAATLTKPPSWKATSTAKRRELEELVIQNMSEMKKHLPHAEATTSNAVGQTAPSQDLQLP